MRMFKKNKSKRIINKMFALILLIQPFVGMIPNVYAASNVYIPLEVTGFNADTILDNRTEAELTSTASVDNHNDVWIASTFPEATEEDQMSGGLFPSDKIIVSTTYKNYKLAKSNELNTLQVGGASGVNEASLTVNTNNRYNKLSFLVTGGDGEATIIATVIYTDGTESTSVDIIAYDWYVGPEEKAIYSGLYKLSKPNGEIQRGNSGKLYETEMDVDSDKIIKEIKFEKKIGDGKANIYAVSGVIYEEYVRTVTFNSNGGSEIVSQSIINESCIEKPTNPTKNGYNFVGWFSNSELTEEFDFNTSITNDITLYAKWIEKSPITDNPETNDTSAITDNPEANDTSAIADNPQTEDNITSSISMLIISILGLFSVLGYMIGNKKTKKITS